MPMDMVWPWGKAKGKLPHAHGTGTASTYASMHTIRKVWSKHYLTVDMHV